MSEHFNNVDANGNAKVIDKLFLPMNNDKPSLIAPLIVVIVLLTLVFSVSWWASHG